MRMDCRTFRKTHVAFVDGAMDIRAEAVRFEHVEMCAHCARLDIAVRRGLLVARNLPQITPSPGFMMRLEVRLKSNPRVLGRADSWSGTKHRDTIRAKQPGRTTKSRAHVTTDGLRRASVSP